MKTVSRFVVGTRAKIGRSWFEVVGRDGRFVVFRRTFKRGPLCRGELVAVEPIVVDHADERGEFAAFARSVCYHLNSWEFEE